jgi:hypothetical protein
VPGLSVRSFAEGPGTCPYWARGPRFGMRTMIFGCGGYGEVAPNHPGAGEAICGGPARVCRRCGGCGVILPLAQAARMG